MPYCLHAACVILRFRSIIFANELDAPTFDFAGSEVTAICNGGVLLSSTISVRSPFVEESASIEQLHHKDLPAVGSDDTLCCGNHAIS